jgi:hypothetical protein
MADTGTGAALCTCLAVAVEVVEVVGTDGVERGAAERERRTDPRLFGNDAEGGAPTLCTLLVSESSSST